MADRAHTCCFTGSRPEKLTFDYRREPYYLDALRRDLRSAVEHAIDAGYVNFISGMSRGFDLWAAEAVLDARAAHPDVRLICAVPFKAQAHHWDAEWRNLFSRVLQQADEIQVLFDQYERGCYYARDRHMVEQSDRVICWYTGAPGGTQYTYQYAQKQGCHIVNLADRQLSFF